MPEKSATIEVAARELVQLFNSLDPSPFPERDLDNEAESYIVSWAKELSPSEHFRIVIHLPKSEILKAEQHGVRRAFSNYFNYRAEMLERSERAGFSSLACWFWRFAISPHTVFLQSRTRPQ